MNTTVVAQSAIGAIAALIGGLGGASIATRHQRSNERRRQRERAAEILGSVWPLLFELGPGSLRLEIPPVQAGQGDPMVEVFAELDARVRVAREQLSTLAGWWSTSRGSDLAWGLQWEIANLRLWDLMAIKDLRSNSDDREVYQSAIRSWRAALQLAEELRGEIRGEAAHIPSKLRLPAHPESWTGPRSTRLLERWF
jgi:hypothetical protein